MIKKSLSLVLCFTTVLNSVAFTAESTKQDKALFGMVPPLNPLEQTPSLKSEIGINLVQDLKHSAMEQVSYPLALGKKVYQDGWESLVTEGIDQFLKSLGNQLFTRHLPPGNRDEFSEDSIYNAIEWMITDVRWLTDLAVQEFFLKDKERYAWDKKNKCRLPIYYDQTTWKTICNKLIPDAMPLKSIFIALTDNNIVRNFLYEQIDRMVIRQVLVLFERSTGKTIKGGIQDALKSLTQRFTAKRQEQTQSSVTTEAISKATSSSTKTSSSKPKQEIELKEEHEFKESLTPLWDYFAPYFSHFIRQGIQSSINDVAITVLEQSSNLAIKKALEQGIIVNGARTIGGGIGYAISNAMPTWLPILSNPYLTGGAFTYGFGWLVGTATQSITKTVTSRLATQIDLVTEHYLDTMLPLSAQEHALFGLNENPSELELSLFSKDYQLRDELKAQTLIGETVHQIVTIAKQSSLFKVIFDIKDRLNRFGEKCLRFLVYCLRSSDEVSTEELMTAADLNETEKQENQQQGNKYLAYLKIGDIIKRQQSGGKITTEEAKLIEDIRQYPSYAMKKLWLKSLQLYREEKTSSLATLRSEVRTATQTQLTHIQTANDILRRQVPMAIALVYQQESFANDCLFPLDWVVVDPVISKQLISALRINPNLDLTLLLEAAQDSELVKSALLGHIQSKIDAQRPKTWMEKATVAETALDDFNIIESLVAPYVEKKNQQYIQQHQSTINTLKSSLMTEGMSLSEIIDLHQHMSEKDLADLKDLAAATSEKERAEEISLIEKKYLFLRKTTQARAQLKEMFSILKNNWSGFVQYAQQIQQKAVESTSQTEVKKLTVADLKNILNTSEWYKSFREQLKQYLPDTAKGSEDYEYRQILYGEINQFLQDELSMHPPAQQVPQKSSSLWGSSSPQLPEIFSKIWKAVEATELKLYEPADIGGFRLIEEISISGISAQNVMELTQNDYELIWTSIHKRKLSKLSSAQQSLLLRPMASLELLRFKSTNDTYKNKLFYGYNEILDLMRKYYKSEVDQIKSQDIRKN